MKFLEKMKNLFTEEVEEVVEEKQIKKEVKQVEIPAPVIKKEEFKVEDNVEKISDSAIINREEKVKVPVYFDDKDFEDLQRPVKKVEPVREKPRFTAESLDPKPYQPVIHEKKAFKPSPIISPVYGVLDQNYTKDDIVPKKDVSISYHRKLDRLTIDDVRQKAYGTLEDELEDTLFGRNGYIETREDNLKNVKESDTLFDGLIEDTKPILSREEYHGTHEEKVVNETKIDSYEKTEEPIRSEVEDLSLEIEKQKAKLDEINKFIKSNVHEEVVEPVEENNDIMLDDDLNEDHSDIMLHNEVSEDDDIVLEEKTEVEKELDSLEEEIKKDISLSNDEEETLEEGDLFNLIDSMYEKGE